VHWGDVLEPGFEAVGVDDTHVPPEAFRAAILLPLFGARPPARRREDKDRLGRDKSERIPCPLLVVNLGFGSYLRVGAEFPR